MTVITIGVMRGEGKPSGIHEHTKCCTEPGLPQGKQTEPASFPLDFNLKMWIWHLMETVGIHKFLQLFFVVVKFEKLWLCGKS